MAAGRHRGEYRRGKRSWKFYLRSRSLKVFNGNIVIIEIPVINWHIRTRLDRWLTIPVRSRLAASYCAYSRHVRRQRVPVRMPSVSTSEWDISSGINLPGSNRLRSFRERFALPWMISRTDRTVCEPRKGLPRHTTTRRPPCPYTRDLIKSHRCFETRLLAHYSFTRAAPSPRVAARTAINTLCWRTQMAGTVLCQLCNKGCRLTWNAACSQ